MKAIVFRAANVKPLMEDIFPPVEAGKKLIKLNAAAFNHREVWITKGLYPGLVPGIIMGADGMGMLDGRRVVINAGLDWGSNENYQSPDFRVLGVPDHGTFAESICIDNKYVYDAPGHLTNEEAAALPVAGVTAYRALIKKCKIQPGEKVFINGLGGGVALFAAQMAKAVGAEVYFTTGTEEKIQKGLKLGFQHGVNYNTNNFIEEILQASGGVDVIIDSIAGDGFSQLIRLCNYGARVAFYGGGKGKINGLNPQTIFWKQISIFGTSMGSDADFAEMLGFIDQYKIKPIIDTVLPFNEYEKGFELLESSSQFGKIVLSIN